MSSCSTAHEQLDTRRGRPTTVAGMDARDLLDDAFGRTRDGVHRVLDGLDVDALTWRPDPDANPIGWLVWHLTRVQDDHVAELAGREQAWTDDGWADRFDLPYDRHDIGYGHTSAEVAAFSVADPALLVDYHDAVVSRTRSYLASLGSDDLDRVVDRRWDPPVTAGVRLVSVVDDQTQHIGQAAYVRGLFERRT
jgi:hypothetical protein